MEPLGYLLELEGRFERKSTGAVRKVSEIKQYRGEGGRLLRLYCRL